MIRDRKYQKNGRAKKRRRNKETRRKRKRHEYEYKARIEVTHILWRNVGQNDVSSVESKKEHKRQTG